MRLGFLTISILIAGAFSVWATNVANQNYYDLRYEVTLVVETPEGIKTGSTIRQISNSVPMIKFPDGGNPGGLRGEAVSVDLGSRGMLFAVIDHAEDHRFYNAFPPPEKAGGASPEGIAYYSTLKVGQKGVLNPKKFPSFPKIVTFSDLDDPKSVKLAYKFNIMFNGTKPYYEITNNLEELFGKGVRIKEITYEITDKPISSSIEKILPWISEINGGFLHGGKISRGADIDLHGGNFRRGEI